MFSESNSDKVLETLASASTSRAPLGRRQAVVNDICANLGLSEWELKRALEDLERAGDIRRVHLDLGCILVTPTGRIRAERLARSREIQERNAHESASFDISTLFG
jgi:hypothetical protein